MIRPGAPTLEDVARAAQVSTATVSRCLNSPERVVEATRLRVLAAVDRLGYSPNFGARALAARRTDTIGAIIPTMENSIFARGIQAFQEELRAHKLTLLIASSSYRPDQEADQIRTLTARGAAGFLLIGHDRNSEIYSFLKRQGVPVLVAWVYDPNNPQPSIGFDNRSSMRALAARVIELGHRDIAMISAGQAFNDRARDRVSGVRDAMELSGLEPQSLRLMETTYGIESGADAFSALMAAETRPTVVMCGNDVLAAGALKRARQMKLRVPEDISITGFDDIELARLLEPALTTVHVPHREMGRQAARMLVDMVEGGAPQASIELQTTLQMRDTLGPPRTV
ncbi:MAG: LacI family DNA-binding transcriptional regulator [Rhodobacteraceae bacterium]|nr:LacI family DNA-binding transcriptional regulator [Paracoccaceae bacterium]